MTPSPAGRDVPLFPVPHLSNTHSQARAYTRARANGRIVRA
jgi:hypothetical protein